MKIDNDNYGFQFTGFSGGTRTSSRTAVIRVGAVLDFYHIDDFYHIS